MGHPQQIIFKRFCAGLLLLLFAFSITPRKALHDLLVSHTDGSTVVAKDGKAQLSKAGYYCDCQSLVAESVFTTSGSITVAAFYPNYNLFPVGHLLRVHTMPPGCFALRGPPSLM